MIGRKSAQIYFINSSRLLQALEEAGRITSKEYSYLDDILERVGPFLLQGNKIRDVVSITGWVEIPNSKELQT